VARAQRVGSRATSGGPRDVRAGVGTRRAGGWRAGRLCGGDVRPPGRGRSGL